MGGSTGTGTRVRESERFPSITLENRLLATIVRTLSQRKIELDKQGLATFLRKLADRAENSIGLM
jgi:hypothetical protein